MGYKTGVAVAIKRSGKYLLVKRSSNDSSPGLWEFPGGKSEKGESYEETGIREIREEAGLELKSLDILGSYIRPRRSGRGNIRMILAYSEDFSGSVKLSEEHSDYRWVEEESVLSFAEPEKIANDVHKFFDLRKKSL